MILCVREIERPKMGNPRGDGPSSEIGNTREGGREPKRATQEVMVRSSEIGNTKEPRYLRNYTKSKKIQVYFLCCQVVYYVFGSPRNVVISLLFTLSKVFSIYEV